MKNTTPPVLWLLAVGAFAIGTDAFVIAGVLPEIADDLRVSPGAAGQLITVFSLTYALFAPVSATITGSLSRRTVLAYGLGVFIVGNVVSALGDSYAWVAAGRFVAALGAASYTPQASAAAASLVPEERRGRALGIVIGGLTVATALGVPIGTWIGGLAGWRATLWAVAALGAVALLGALMLPRLAPAGRHPLAERLSGLRNPAVLITLSVTLLAVTSEHVVYTYIGPVLQDTTHGGRALSVLLFVFGVGAVAGNAVAGIATDRLGNRAVLLLAVGGMAVDLALLPLWSGSLIGAGVALFVWGATGWMYLVPQQHRLLSLSEASGPFTVALNSSALYLGIAIGGAVGGLLVNAWGPESTAVPAFVLAAVAVAVAALTYGRPTPTGPARETRSDPARQGVSDDD
ncbi:MFS transporter [Streptomyces sp. TRM76323]|uniref:MFS transporter n=1 Tax=Streptomyces tamarix TaxID=3078565 RepID=A0ABU3QE55_9ACTN|nr:MFS transporter [Streptomyces tamarix]MDT9681033.1 MFS transporter [Streptomyces tamarix]